MTRRAGTAARSCMCGRMKLYVRPHSSTPHPHCGPSARYQHNSCTVLTSWLAVGRAAGSSSMQRLIRSTTPCSRAKGQQHQQLVRASAQQHPVVVRASYACCPEAAASRPPARWPSQHYCAAVQIGNATAAAAGCAVVLCCCAHRRHLSHSMHAVPRLQQRLRAWGHSSGTEGGAMRPRRGTSPVTISHRSTPVREGSQAGGGGWHAYKQLAPGVRAGWPRQA